ncbi:unnamed protein product [Vicia faba]|uniref:Uncharacterized protein n=1 Tax=Vicia faba TaxID=3906 RepID=A0AAV0Z7V2_VICFA|nr:unnamed protein product [Vicia faba]
MVPSRENRCKARVGENASGVVEQESIPQEPFMKQRRLLSGFRIMSIIIPKYVNLTTFPSCSFNFPALFEYQHVNGFVSEYGPYYPDLVRGFYAYLSIQPGCAFHTKVRGLKIGMTLAELGNCLGVPYEGEQIHHGYTLSIRAWAGYSKLDFYFSISLIS